MKKFLSGAILAILLILNSSFVSAQNEDNFKKVFFIKAYVFDKIDNIYKEQQYWSSVLIAKNKIITNAHVVLDENDDPLWNYNLCITDDFSKKPVCETTLKLLYYNIEKDLALLEPIKNIDLWEPVTISSQVLNLEETVKVYWYPSNGWNTITFTEWKISWKEEWYYKIDANIDHGNSWWWAFNKNWELVGIPTIASVWLSTLGYITPVDIISDFLDSKDFVKYEKTDSLFIKNINNINSVISGQKIDNKYFGVSNPQKFGFKITDYNFDNAWDIQYCLLEDKNNKTIIMISKSLKIGLDLSDKNIQKGIEESLKLKYAKVIRKTDFTLAWKKIKKLIILKWLIGEKKSDNIITIGFELDNNILFSVTTDDLSKNKESFINWIKLLLSDFKINKINNSSNNIVDFDVFDFKINSNIGFIKSIMPDINNTFVVKNKTWIIAGIIDVTKLCDKDTCSKDNSDWSLKDFSQKLVKKLPDNYYLWSVNKSKKWLDYLILTSKEDDKISIELVFLLNDTEGNIYMSTLSTTWKEEKNDDLTQVNQLLIDFFENINIKWKSPFKKSEIWDIKMKD